MEKVMTCRMKGDRVKDPGDRVKDPGDLSGKLK